MFARQSLGVWAAVVAAGLAVAPPLTLALGGTPRAGRRRNGIAPPKRVSTPAPAAVPSADDPATERNTPTVDVLTGLRDGRLAAEAQGMGDGRIELSITNRSKQPLRVVLPPGLIASGASGQFGGMGGMGGGMGGMGGGMGGMGGGMGGMGGGMGGMGGGMGRMGGGMMGGMGRGGGTMPATMGMMMLGRLIMTLIGDRDSWNMSSLMMGMGGMGMGMGGMGGMGGGMGGMGGMMGGGFRSVPRPACPRP